MRTKWLPCAVLLTLLACLPLCGQSKTEAVEDEDALRSATRAICPAEVAMLGESATHGDGHTVRFKVALVERLIDQCGFDSVFFEANQEEFLHLNWKMRMGQSVVPGDLLAAVGGLWSFDREFQPMAPFLLTRAMRGQIFLGGLDDQLGQFGQDYANVAMVHELAGLLAEPQRGTCEAALHRRVFYDYAAAAPYSRLDRTQIDGCLAGMKAALDAVGGEGPEIEDEREMIAATERWIGRDFSSGAEGIVNRDRSMFQTFVWLRHRVATRHKVIVWAATVHIAKQGNPAWGDHAGTNFGTLVHREYGDRAYSLGFGALSGSYRQGRGNFVAMPAVPADAVEAGARLDGGTGGYVGAAELAAMGTRPGAFFVHAYQTLAWSEFLDGVVVFRAEQPPGDVRGK